MKNLILAFASVCAFGVFAENSGIPLPEHPRPDWERGDWRNLNGSWLFASDRADAGVGEKWQEAADDKFPQRILVPFGWGSPASGVKDEADVGWYRRDISVPAEWKGRRVFLVVGASDHDTTCWFDGAKLGEHSGGYTPFEFELTQLVKWGSDQKITFRVWDAAAGLAQHDWRLYGKQGYGNVRGIWQTVYLEARGETYVESARFSPDIDNSRVTAEVKLGAPAKKLLALTVGFRPEDRAESVVAKFEPGQMTAKLEIPLEKAKLWDLEHPHLYEVRLNLSGEGVQDAVSTYFGMRKIGVGRMPGTGYPYVTLNNKPIYLQLTLDQSYHPEGFYTFPSDEFMKNEILISKRLGLSGNRVHIKAEIPRKLYWADRLGLLIMADVPCAWGAASEAMFREHWHCFEDMVGRDYNHPCVFSWVLFNETWGLFCDGRNWGADSAARYVPWTQRAVADAYRRAKALDPTRLVEDNSPCNRDHVITDLDTWHGYLPGWKWENRIADECDKTFPGSASRYIGGFVQTGAPMLNSECGNVWGYKGSTGDCDWSWDYHMMINAFRRRPKCSGWLYTEHHDVINEWNGYVRFDRTPKETGIEELFPGMSLNDLHADAYLPLDTELCREFKAGETWKIPVDISLTTDRYEGRELKITCRLRYWNDRGRLVENSRSCGSFTASSWQHGSIRREFVKLPDETACGVVCFELADLADGGRAIARNFACFVTRGGAKKNTVSVPAARFAKAEWSQREWNVLDGRKVCGAGKGFFEYEFALPKDAKKATFRAEVGAKRLNGKDSKDLDKGVRDLDCMLGGGFADRSKNPNSYPMTCAYKWPSTLVVRANGEKVATVELPDDPADHRGILSWFAQPRNDTLHEAGSYGYLVEANIPESVVEKSGGKVTIRLETEKGGLAVYGSGFGRFPLDPSVEY